MARRKRVHTLASFVVKKSPGRGKGVFANVRIGKGETIGYYTGDILRDWHSTREPYNTSLYLMYVCKDHWINAVGPRSNYTRYINHSYRPNAELIVSTRWKTARIESSLSQLSRKILRIRLLMRLYWSFTGDSSQESHLVLLMLNY